MTYQETLDFLFPLHRFGIKPGLERVRLLLEAAGSPEHRLGKVVHVAGTNGKGTAASAVASIFTASGRKTALYTSPHLVDFTERMRIDGRPIGEDEVARYATVLKEAALRLHSTFFEVTTAIALCWFADSGVEVSVIETGMGGRLDATNVVRSDYALLTGIGLDHTEWLGTTIGAIAAEKAAIIKPRSKVFTSIDPDGGAAAAESFPALRDAAAACGSALQAFNRDFFAEAVHAEPGLLELDVVTAGGRFGGLRAPLTGAFHAAGVAAAVALALDAGVGEDAVRLGLDRLLSTGYRARLELIGRRPDILLDVSHNAEGMRATVDALLPFAERYGEVLPLFGLASDKDGAAMLRELMRLGRRFAVADLPTERGVSSRELAELCRSLGAEARAFDTPAGALSALRRQAAPDTLILVTGSFYLAGALLESGAFGGGRAGEE
ncbi:Mur ligase family protein [Chlorobium sp. N1]|uniref:bifunctional folylpolyglutamate synthase/dihydrofolate synthase n=1 Tax=Chlorobium sp. N1 TaxID=2491138 RepID=UPI00103BAF5D|nr:Mur ligase family protein [Chlorobium sp. N1]TCD48887.1 bifunctional folylpolyglutamate synthase/dihydrofolate synthase [Chlorobium sp. N1]